MARTRCVEKSLSSIDSLTVNNDKAVVIVTHAANRVLEDAQGQAHRWENKVVHKETRTKTANGWKIKQLEELKQIYLLTRWGAIAPIMLVSMEVENLTAV